MKWLLPLLLLTLLATAAMTCQKDDACPENFHNGLTIHNLSERRICFEFYWNYPDTMIGDYNPLEANALDPQQRFTRGAGPASCWESIMSKDRREWIYFFDADTLAALDWTTVRLTQRGLLERRLITRDVLEQNNYDIAFP